MRLGAIVLAAGAATRMGCVKQLLPYCGTTLVEYAIRQAQEAGFHPIVAVVGAQAHAVEEAVLRSSADCVLNANWESGMGSSIVSGVTRLLAIAPATDAIAVLLADQPYVCARHLLEMRRVFNSAASPVLASKYAGTVGVPAIFGSSFFANLRNLAPGSGARGLLRQGGTAVQLYEFPEAAMDVDTPEDFAAISRLPT